MKKPMKKPMTSSPRPKPRPADLVENFNLMRAMKGTDAKAVKEDLKAAKKMAMGGKVSEYGGKEMYKSKAAMMKHEGSESMAEERKERKMAMGGKCRGMGAASKGGNYKG